MTYYAKSPIKHNGARYERGDVVPSDIANAEQLLEEGVLSDFPVKPEEDATPEAPAEERADLPKVGGTEGDESGEGTNDTTQSSGNTGADVTPGSPAREGFIGRIFNRPTGDEVHVITEADVEAHPEILDNGLKVGDEIRGAGAVELKKEAEARAAAGNA